MQTFIICIQIAALYILVLGVSTRIIEDLTEIELDVRQIRRELKDGKRSDK